MAERVQTIDGVCPKCKRIILRVLDVVEPSHVQQIKAELVERNLLPRHYETDKPLKPTTSHIDGCELA